MRLRIMLTEKLHLINFLLATTADRMGTWSRLQVVEEILKCCSYTHSSTFTCTKHEVGTVIAALSLPHTTES